MKTTYANRVKHVRSQIAASDTLSEERVKEIESMSDKELLESFYPRLKADDAYQVIKMSTYQEVHKGELSMVDLGLNLFAGLAMVGGIVLAPFTGGASLYATYAGGTYLAGSSAYSAVTGNTLITGDRLSGVERTFAGIEAVTTVLSLGGTAVGSSGLKVGNQATKVLTTLGNVANKTDDVMEVVQLGYGIGTGDAESALAKFALGKGMEFGTKAVVGNLTKGLSVHAPQVQLNARQGQEFVDLQVVEFGKVAHKVEKNITIQMVVDGVEQKIRVDAIGFDEAGKIRIQEYTTAQTGLKSSRQNLLEDLSQYGGVIVGAGKGDFVGGVEIPKGTRIDVVSQKTGNVTITDGLRIQNSGYFNAFGQEIVSFHNSDFSPTAKAQSWQGSGTYPGIDKYVDVRFNKGDKIYILESEFEVANNMQSGYATTFETVEQSGYDARKLSESLQIKPYYDNSKGLDVAEYRQQVTEYTIMSDDLYAAFGEETVANPHFGDGGAPQYFIKDFQEQVLSGKISRGKSYLLTNFEISADEYIRMIEMVD